jgi:dATP/dGTP diphosphohydrolase
MVMSEGISDLQSLGGLPDTGARTVFETGAQRDAMEGKGMPHLIPAVAIRKMALRFELGARKYGVGNWMQGIPLSRFQDAIMRHTLAHAEGKTDEDHLGAALWNAAAWAWTEEQIQAGRLPVTLDDLPFRFNASNK